LDFFKYEPGGERKRKADAVDRNGREDKKAKLDDNEGDEEDDVKPASKDATSSVLDIESKRRDLTFRSTQNLSRPYGHDTMYLLTYTQT